jgi:hypothetical protein
VLLRGKSKTAENLSTIYRKLPKEFRQKSAKDNAF